MFDLRYHVASLTAVFFALVIGILVGVALASHGLGNTERKRLERQVDAANAQASQAQERVTALTDEGEANAAFVREAYTAVMADRLQGRRIAVLFIGKVDRPLLSSIDSTLDDAGAPAQRRLRALTVPIDDKALNQILRRRKQLASYAGPANLANLGRELAHEFVVGGDTPLWDALENNLVEEKSGRMGRPADGVVVVRNATPQANGTATFLSGLYSGLADSRVPVVGVETTDTMPSVIPVFQEYSLSSVDDLDKRVGRLALAVVLSGVASGAYGIKDTADAVLPEITPVASSGTGG